MLNSRLVFWQILMNFLNKLLFIWYFISYKSSYDITLMIIRVAISFLTSLATPTYWDRVSLYVGVAKGGQDNDSYADYKISKKRERWTPVIMTAQISFNFYLLFLCLYKWKYQPSMWILHRVWRKSTVSGFILIKDWLWICLWYTWDSTNIYGALIS